jgi:hypothetical protein
MLGLRFARALIRHQPSISSLRYFSDAKKPPTDDEIKIDFKDINEKLEKTLKSGKIEEMPNVDPKFMSFKKEREKASHERSHIFTWKSALITLVVGGTGLSWLLYMRKTREAEMEKQQKNYGRKSSNWW